MIKSVLKNIFKRKRIIPEKYAHYECATFLNMQEKFKAYNIGDFTYGQPSVFDFSAYDDIATQPTTLTIGKFCSLADVKIVLGSEHRTDWVSTYPFNALSTKFRHIKGHPLSRGNITIGNDVWIATGVTILSGVSIGNGAVIGANSLVNKNIPAYSIAAGSPASIIKLRFSNDKVNELEKIKWWDLPLHEIEEYVELLQSSEIDKLIETIKNSKNA